MCGAQVPDHGQASARQFLCAATVKGSVRVCRRELPYSPQPHSTPSQPSARGWERGLQGCWLIPTCSTCTHSAHTDLHAQHTHTAHAHTAHAHTNIPLIPINTHHKRTQYTSIAHTPSHKLTTHTCTHTHIRTLADLLSRMHTHRTAQLSLAAP